MAAKLVHDLIETIQENPIAATIAERLQPAIKDLFGRMPHGPAVKELLHGESWLGHPLHPILTDVPIGAWMMSALFDAIAWNDRDSTTARLADLCVCFGLASALPTVATGLTDWSTTTRRASRIDVVHAASNVAATVLYAGSMVSRANRSMRLTLAYSGFCVMLLGGFLGGHLAFSEGVGVDEPAETPNTDWAPASATDGFMTTTK